MKQWPEPFPVCFEATCGYGDLYDELAKIARRVLMAHPGRLRLIFRSKRKSDRVDAENLAKLLYLEGGSADGLRPPSRRGILAGQVLSVPRAAGFDGRTDGPRPGPAAEDPIAIGLFQGEIPWQATVRQLGRW